MNARGRLLVLALAALAALSVWWLRQLQSTTTRERAAPTHRIDYTMDKFELTAMNTTGKPQYRLRAASMAHFADDDSAEFEQPRVEYLDQDSTRLRFTAERGWMAAKGAEIKLLGAVRIEGFAKQPFTLLTRDVRFLPEEQLASTDAAVELTGMGLRISAVGMQADIDAERVRFLTKVRGRYEPAQ